MPKRKADCTPEEWAAIRERARKYDATQRAKPERQQYMKDYMASYTKTPEYRESDNARYGDDRREKQLSRLRARAYGASPVEVAMLRDLQQGKCAVCGVDFAPPRPGGKHGTECLDHCHTTKKVRGLLCRMCNTFEGFLLRRGLAPADYAASLQAYLDNPPADMAKDIMEIAG
jgi:hypothetical protein